MIKYTSFLLAILLSLNIHSEDVNYLAGNVPEDIFLEMKKRDCSVIPDFYAMDRSQGGERIGSPYDDGYAIENGRRRAVTVFGCKLFESVSGMHYKLVILYSDKRKSTRQYSCLSEGHCPVVSVRVYENFDSCGHEILLKNKPAGIDIMDVGDIAGASIEFTDSTDLGAVGTIYSCVDGKWEEYFMH